MTEESLFLAALDRPPADRPAFLDEACGHDPALRQRLDLLLAAFAAGRDKLEPPPEQTIDYTAPELGAGAVIGGRYKLLEKIGEGGMGEVWVAKQTEPVQRKVALKLIKAGMDSQRVVTRFEQERQALALMDHPNIARVLDGGLTADRRPFFVMELVNGQPLTKFCDEAKLTPRERLELFIPVCQAVQHAHTKGIVHRDLKPSNVLVTLYDGRPVPKVIDFGVAKATGGRLTDESLSTQFGAVIGTFEYMAPEQAGFSALDVDTRADVYSLGVILYELLTGLRPFDGQRLRQAAFDEMVRIIREEEPPKPSTKLSGDASLASAAAVRKTEPKKLAAQVRGDLDWIVMKALEKDRNRRYETANGFAMDVRRFLAGEPVLAVPPSAGYRLRKFVRRNKGQVVAAGLVALALLAGGLGTTFGMVQARRQRDAAEERLDRAVAAEALASARLDEATAAARRADIERSKHRAVYDFFLKQLLGQADPGNQAPGPDDGPRNANLTVRALLDRAERRIAGQFKKTPVIEAHVRFALASTYRALGETAKALPHAERAAALLAEHEGPRHTDTLAARLLVAWLYTLSREPAKAEPIFRDILAIETAAGGPTGERALRARHNVAWVAQNRGDLPAARAAYLELRPALAAALGPGHPDALACRMNLADVYYKEREFAAAEAEYQAVYDGVAAAQGADHPKALQAKAGVARVAKARGDYPRAERLMTEAVAESIATLGPDDPAVLSRRADLAGVYQARGDLARAEALLTSVVVAAAERFGPTHSWTIPRKTDLAVVLFGRRKFAAAEGAYREAYEAARAHLGPDAHETLRSQMGLAQVLRARGDFARAEPLYHDVVARTAAVHGPDHRLTWSARSGLGTLYWSMRRLDRSIPLFEQVHAARVRQSGPASTDALTAAGNLGVNYRDAGRLAEAIPLLEGVHRAADQHPSLSWVGPQLATAYIWAQKTPELVALTVETACRDKVRLKAGSKELADRLALGGSILVGLGAFAEAEPLLREALAVREKAAPAAWTTASARSLLGQAVAGQGRFGEAEPLLLAGYAGLRERAATIPAAVRPVRLTEAAERLVRLYAAWGKWPEAAKWRAELSPVEPGPAPRAVTPRPPWATFKGPFEDLP